MATRLSSSEIKELDNGIWWLASYPKSGNTWARQVINCAVSGFPPAINSGFQYVTADFGRAFYGCTAAVDVNDMDSRDVLMYRLAALRNQMAMFDHRDVALKTHHACLTIFDVPLIPHWMTKGAVYIVRDPRDVCISYAKHTGNTIDKAIMLMGKEESLIKMDEDLARIHYLGSWSINVESWLHEDNPIGAVCIRYEDMLSDTFNTFRKLLNALGLEMITDDLLETAIDRCHVDKLRALEQKIGFRERSTKAKENGHTFFGKGVAGGWKETLSEKQVEQIERDHGEIMQELGYELVSLVSV